MLLLGKILSKMKFCETALETCAIIQSSHWNNFALCDFFLPELGTLSEKEIQKNRLIFYRKPLLNNIAIKSFQSNGSLKTCVVKNERNATCLKDKTAMVEKRQVLVWAVVAAASNY